MEAILLLCFLVGYIFIAFEHKVKYDKMMSAAFMLSIMWTIVALFDVPVFGMDHITHKLVEIEINDAISHHFEFTWEILTFLIGAMTIVEIVQLFDGFEEIKKRIRFRSKRKLLWVFCWLGFILSAIVDNLTASIILGVILSKLTHDRNVLFWYGGMIVIATNAGGAWSPIGDVTTTMLWINHKVTTLGLLEHVVAPSVVCLFVPLLFATFFVPAFKGDLEIPEIKNGSYNQRKAQTILAVGLGMIVFVPFFKGITHLPPWMGMFFSVGVVGTVAEIISRGSFEFKQLEEDTTSHAHGGHSSNLTLVAIRKIEHDVIWFFLGILMAVGVLESVGMLVHAAGWLEETLPLDLVILALGTCSAIVDNVPLVAAAMGMFHFEVDDQAWHFIAYAAGTGGSMIGIGSAAGVYLTTKFKIGFFDYLKKIGPLAFLGFLSGAAVFILLRPFLE